MTHFLKDVKTASLIWKKLEFVQFSISTPDEMLRV